MVETLRLEPNSPPQRAFLASSADIAVYGGAAGGGKSYALLLEAIRHANNPGFGGVIFRRLSPQITNEGGLWDTADKIYPLLGAQARVGTLEYRFPPGSRLAFRHLQHEKTKQDWQGSQIPFIGFDELTHFSESQFFYMLSRNRSLCGVRPYVRATTNPDAGSWVKRFLAPWVDRKFKDPARSGEIRWFHREKGELHWARTPAELVAKFPAAIPKSVTFIRASVYDNVDLLRDDPGYLANLMAQGEVDRARLLDGNWDIVNDGLVYPDFGSIVIEPEEWPTLGAWNFGGIDWGFNNPFGALAAWLDGDDVLWVGWERHGRGITLSEHSKALPRGAIRWFADPAGADQIAELRAAEHDIVPCVHLGQQPLSAGIGLVTERIRTRRLRVLGTLGHLIDEAGKYRYDGESKTKSENPVDRDNHLLAGIRYLIVGLDRGKSVSDRAPQPTQEQLAEAKAIADEILKKQRDEARREYYDPEADHWYGG